MAAGKSRFGKKLAKHLDLPFIDLDNLILTKTGKSAASWIVEDGEEAFRTIERHLLLETINLDRFLISTGGGTPCYSDNIALMNKAGTTVWLNTSFGHILQRLEMAKTDRPLLEKNSAGLDRNKIETLYKKRLIFYKQAKIVIPAADIELAISSLAKL